MLMTMTMISIIILNIKTTIILMSMIMTIISSMT